VARCKGRLPKIFTKSPELDFTGIVNFVVFKDGFNALLEIKETFAPVSNRKFPKSSQSSEH
jgi:hypothetical protein